VVVAPALVIVVRRPSSSNPYVELVLSGRVRLVTLPAS
jgi:hypothetical protein